MSETTLRLAARSDAAACRDIYAPYVEDTAVTFETSVPSADEFRERIADTLESYPWLVCERDGEVVGYAHASELRTQGAYRWTVESSVYVADRAQGEGVGRALYGTLLDLLELQGYVAVYAGVTLPNPASVALHDSLGFERESTNEAVGYKAGAWRDVSWWYKELSDRPESPDEPLSVAEARESERWAAAIESGGKEVE